MNDDTNLADTAPVATSEAKEPVSQPQESKFDAMIKANEKAQASKAQEPKKEEPSEKDDTPTDWEKRYKDLQKEKDRQVSETLSQAETIAKDRIEQDPSYIHTLAEKNKALADRIIKNDESCKKAGIKNYDELKAHIEKSSLPDESKALMEKEIDPLKKTVQELQTKLSEKEKAEAETFITQFKEQNPEFKGKAEEKTWELFNKTDLTLNEAWEYIKYKEGIKEDINQREEKAWQNLQSKKLAGAIPSTGSRGSVSKKTQKTAEELSFLEGIGAKKTLQQYS